MEQWLKNPVNGYTGQNYKRRLLVLTEPYMLDWLNEKSLRDSDEVLVLKAIGEDVDNYAGIGLGNRLHSLNISASISARRFSQYMDARIAREIERGYESRINKDMVTLLRLFSNEEVNYRDSLSETLEELRGDELELEFKGSGELGGIDIVKLFTIKDIDESTMRWEDVYGRTMNLTRR
jgi:hypothetical protein